jgi:hypothetical protein
MNEWVMLVIGAIATAALVGGAGLISKVIGGKKDTKA